MKTVKPWGWRFSSGRVSTSLGRRRITTNRASTSICSTRNPVMSRATSRPASGGPFDQEKHADGVRRLILSQMSNVSRVVDDDWVDTLFAGCKQKELGGVIAKYKIIFLPSVTRLPPWSALPVVCRHSAYQYLLWYIKMILKGCHLP